MFRMSKLRYFVNTSYGTKTMKCHYYLDMKKNLTFVLSVKSTNSLLWNWNPESSRGITRGVIWAARIVDGCGYDKA